MHINKLFLKYSTIFFFITIALFSCKEYSQKRIIESEELIVPLEKRINPTTMYMQAFSDNNEEFLAYLNSFENSIEIFNLSIREHVSTIELEFDGSDGVGEVRGFHIISLDSILITSKSYQSFFLVNSKSELVDKFHYGNHPKITGPFYSRTDFNNSIHFENNKIFFTQYPPSPWNSLPESEYINSPIEFHLDIIAGKVDHLNYTFPDDLRSEFDYPPYFSRVHSPLGFVYAFFYSNKIFLNHEGKLISKPLNIEIPDILPYKKEESITESMSFDIMSPAMTSILYDEKRELFYLIYYLGDEVDSTTDLSKKAKHKFKAIILALNLEVISLLDISKYRLNIRNSFVGENGLYISKNNDLNLDFDENNLTFVNFTVK